ncbi:MAG: hypothetical protein ACYDIA_07295 [Candidatus Humimicrobiaceae bacterium]
MVSSSAFDSITNEYYTQLKKLARVWDDQNDKWQDAKSKEIAVNIIQPVSASGKKVLNQVNNVKKVLLKLYQERIISEI